VRAPFASLWRAEVFDSFDGTVWTRSSSRLVSLQANGEGGYDVVSGVSNGWGRPLVQTFFIEQTQPNVLFAAGTPRTVYFPSGGLQVDRDLSVRSPILLDQGLVYSVESSVSDFTPDELQHLRFSIRNPDGRPVRRYLQLPAELPQRVRDLAVQITAGSRTEYDAVMAVQTWLQTNTRYDLTVPREPDGVDAIDYFLFETRRGFCEHIAAAMAVLLRAEGIPTRIVTGYGPGERNPFTGYFEVRNSDAHAWLEVLYPGVGWVPYDPTFGVPAVPDAWGSSAGADLVAWAGGQFQDHVPVGVRDAVTGAAGTLFAVVRSVARSWPAVVVVVVAVLLGVALRRRRRRAARAGPPDRIGEAYEDLVATLAAAGHACDPSHTPAEVGAVADVTFVGEAAKAADTVVTTFQRARYARPPDRPSDADVMRALAAAARVRELTRHH
jgi:transglutaminase-like putative cysteine protease